MKLSEAPEDIPLEITEVLYMGKERKDLIKAGIRHKAVIDRVVVNLGGTVVIIMDGDEDQQRGIPSYISEEILVEPI